MMVSHAQNAEDVVLARLLGPGPGFYVDCGAANPMNDSVTRHFYEHGWRGINIEPRTDAAQAVARARPEDVTLNVAVGDADGEVTFHVREDDPHQSSVVLTDGPGTTITVPCRSLDSILEEHRPERFDFLKIDVEGHERAVLQGIDLHRWRPQVIVIEAVKPWSTERVDAEWRDLVLDRGYQEALFDGINLFFVADELGASLPVPPASPLDRFVPARVHALEKEVRELRARLAERAVVEPAPAPTPLETRPASETHRWVAVGPGTGEGASLGKVLASTDGAVEIAVAHPGDIDWAGLPERCVLSLSWRPSTLLTRLLAEYGVRPVCVSPDSDWWQLPGTVRVDPAEFLARPEAAVASAMNAVAGAASEPGAPSEPARTGE